MYQLKPKRHCLDTIRPYYMYMRYLAVPGIGGDSGIVSRKPDKINEIMIPHSITLSLVFGSTLTACFMAKRKEPYPAALRREGFGILMSNEDIRGFKLGIESQECRNVNSCEKPTKLENRGAPTINLKILWST